MNENTEQIINKGPLKYLFTCRLYRQNKNRGQKCVQKMKNLNCVRLSTGMYASFSNFIDYFN